MNHAARAWFSESLSTGSSEVERGRQMVFEVRLASFCRFMPLLDTDNFTYCDTSGDWQKWYWGLLYKRFRLNGLSVYYREKSVYSVSL